ncbi:aliphatic sulfonate ABC transporter substrate-binding protein [Dactylosporangium vinaceum]|uniref:Aliphatic sulfonate ABC transporter substrate-binding protein n=1 Tax=Dactylosporangium vinaceum TaxID=53362 RepID=A0ABV5M9K3_9ACTN|nr:aliphatic sulfonate ABC transporter substrate-binding protein [Dactylosporangium vinaceum]UAC00032.1 aliphatic sulfonate ABC transporter substrate-binding protein [Dactylosporangium vinaceum]
MHRLTVIAAVALTLLGTTLSGCAKHDGTPATPAAGTAEEPLKVGYQRFGGLSLVKARKTEAAGTVWSLFESGPALTEGLKAGAIDIGQVGEAPPIFAAAGKIDFRIIGTSQPVPKGEAVLVKDASGYRSFKDLKGKKVALNKGSNVNWLLVKLLDANGMTIKDIDVQYLKPADARPAFDNNQIDAWIIWDPYFALAEIPGTRVLVDGDGLVNNREYILVSPQALKTKPGKIREFLKTYRETTDWGIAHPEERVKLIAPELNIPEDVARRALGRSAQPLAPVTPAIGDELQQIADGFTGLQLIPGKVDIKARVDEQFADLLR